MYIAFAQSQCTLRSCFTWRVREARASSRYLEQLGDSWHNSCVREPAVSLAAIRRTVWTKAAFAAEALSLRHRPALCSDRLVQIHLHSCSHISSSRAYTSTGSGISHVEEAVVRHAHRRDVVLLHDGSRLCVELGLDVVDRGIAEVRARDGEQQLRRLERWAREQRRHDLLQVWRVLSRWAGLPGDAWRCAVAGKGVVQPPVEHEHIRGKSRAIRGTDEVFNAACAVLGLLSPAVTAPWRVLNERGGRHNVRNEGGVANGHRITDDEHIFEGLTVRYGRSCLANLRTNSACGVAYDTQGRELRGSEGRAAVLVRGNAVADHRVATACVLARRAFRAAREAPRALHGLRVRAASPLPGRRLPVHCGALRFTRQPRARERGSDAREGARQTHRAGSDVARGVAIVVRQPPAGLPAGRRRCESCGAEAQGGGESHHPDPRGPLVVPGGARVTLAHRPACVIPGKIDPSALTGLRAAY